MKTNNRNKLTAVILFLIYLFFAVESLFFGFACPPECRILALLFFLGLVIMVLPILNSLPIIKIAMLAIAIFATICYSLMAFFFFDNYPLILLSIANVIALGLLIILERTENHINSRKER